MSIIHDSLITLSTHTHTHPPSGVTINGAHAAARYLCRLAPPTSSLYGTTNLEKAEIDHWLEFSLSQLTQQQGAPPTVAFDRLDAILAPRVFLVGYELSLADLAVYSSVKGECLCV